MNSSTFSVHFIRRVLIALAFCPLVPAQAQVAPPVQVDLVPWATGIPYITEMASCGDSRLFAATQGGSIFIVTDSMTVLPTPFLNIYWLVYFSGEQGLIGLTFDPDYATNGYFYVNYTQPFAAGHNTIVSRFTVSSEDPNVADPTSEVVLMSIPQPGIIHKAGDLEFGPDGYLYLSIGDGGPQGDPANSAQNLNSRLGKILRIDVHADGTWGIPPSNPFATAVSDTLPEIYAYGVRNPFRIDVDPVTSDLWFGDVGQSSFEEVNRMPSDTSGVNFGWRCYEGNMPNITGGCPADSLLAFPVVTHANILNGGDFCAVIGGKVYRGGKYPRLYGRYIYTDYCSGAIRSITPTDSGTWNDESLRPGGLAGNTCISLDNTGELFLSNQITQTIYKITDHCPMQAPVLTDLGSMLVCSDAQSYTWFLDGDTLTHVTGPELDVEASGHYWVVADMGGGCLFTTDTVQVITTGVPSERSIALAIYPNPASDLITVVLPSGTSSACTLELLDLLGRPVRKWPTSCTGPVELSMADIPAGRYVVRLSTSTGVYCAGVGVVH